MTLVPSVIVQVLGGGLGNQLFDYSAARTLADRHSGQLVLDSSTVYSSNTPEFLSAFGIRASFRKLPNSPTSLVNRVYRRIKEDVSSTRIVRAKNEYGYMLDWQHLPRRCQIVGNLISPRFFRDNEQKIRADLHLTDRSLLNFERYQLWASAIKGAQNAIGVHIRRGDLLLPENQWIVLPGIHQYMADAVAYITQRVAQPRIFVFSVDPDWCMAGPILGSEKYEVVSVSLQSRVNTLTDFSLMRLCRHIVMPNSSFSWWAAYLRDDPGITVLPKLWDPAGVIPPKDMLMPNWLQL